METILEFARIIREPKDFEIEPRPTETELRVANDRLRQHRVPKRITLAPNGCVRITMLT